MGWDGAEQDLQSTMQEAGCRWRKKGRKRKRSQREEAMVIASSVIPRISEKSPVPETPGRAWQVFPEDSSPSPAMGVVNPGSIGRHQENGFSLLREPREGEKSMQRPWAGSQTLPCLPHGSCLTPRGSGEEPGDCTPHSPCLSRTGGDEHTLREFLRADCAGILWGAAITKHPRWGGFNNKNLFSQFWRLLV